MNESKEEIIARMHMNAAGPKNQTGIGLPPCHAKDPWAHRSAGMTCSTCMWGVWKAPTTDARITEDPLIEKISPRRMIGRCRRHAPTMSGYPVVYEDDWCGDHKLDENKI